MRLKGCLIAFGIWMLTLGQVAYAELVIQVDKLTQRMTVTRDGQDLYEWPVSTGARGYETPSGAFKPFRMEANHFSDEYDQSPMPHSIFFTQTGIAIHGTYEGRNLGRAVSHGCVRLSLKNAATLWALVKDEKMANTRVVLRGPGADRKTHAAKNVSLLPLNSGPALDDGLRPQRELRGDESPATLSVPLFLFGR
jgi:hypothetical protein